MNGRSRLSRSRGTTLIEILVAVTLLLMIFLFLTGDLMQSSQAENVAATRTESISASNYLLAVMRQDTNFWSDWNTGPAGLDPCGNLWPPYTDSITTQGGWHNAPACLPNGSNAGAFPDLIGVTAFQFKWNAKNQGSPPDPRVAELTTWVLVNQGGRQNIYELHGTRGNIAAPASPAGILPPTATPTSCQQPCPSMSPSPPPSPTPRPSPSPRGSGTPKPTPKPSGTFE
jgi:type II secretory pathway pseudopilin PulG